jgi:hypothetical protein
MITADVPFIERQKKNLSFVPLGQKLLIFCVDGIYSQQFRGPD